MTAFCPLLTLFPYTTLFRSLQRHLQGADQPITSVLLLMPSDDVAVALDLGTALLDKPSFDVAPGELDHDHIAVHRLVATNAKIGQSQSSFQVEVLYLA